MTRTEALLMMLQMVEECKTHSGDAGGCMECPFGCGANCLASDGNDTPETWLVADKVYEWTKE